MSAVLLGGMTLMNLFCSLKTLRAGALVCWLTLILSAVQPMSAQEASSGINGHITDQSGGGIPKSDVTARNTATNVKETVKSNAGGYFEFPTLPAGEYVLSATSPGFSTAESSPFEIETGKSSRVDLPLKIGTEVTTVDVSSAATLLNTTSNEVGTTVSQQEMENLPVQNRNLFDLIALQPGVNASQSGEADSTNQNARGGFEVNGAPGLSNSILLDGVDATFGEDNGAGAGNQVAINTVGIGAIAEFRTSSSVPPVQYGRAAGGILTITTKSGTNKTHGQIFEYFRNDVLDANTWANNRATPVVPVPKLRFNEFGGNVGGPILKNRTFYFVSYEGSRVIQGNSTTTSQIPSPFLIQKMAAQTKTPNYQLITQELQMMPLPNSPAIPFDPTNPTVNSGTMEPSRGILTTTPPKIRALRASIRR